MDDYQDNVRARTGLAALAVALGLFGLAGGGLLIASRPKATSGGERAAVRTDRAIQRDGGDGPRTAAANQPILDVDLPPAAPGKDDFLQPHQPNVREEAPPVTPALPEPSPNDPVNAIKAYVRLHANDTDGLEFLRWGEPRTVRLRATNQEPAMLVRALIRARNALGAKVVQDYLFLVQHGKVAAWVPTKDAHKLNPPSTEDLLRDMRRGIEEFERTVPNRGVTPLPEMNPGGLVPPIVHGERP